MQPLSSEPGVPNLGALSEQMRGERIQKKILAANLATQVVNGADFLDPSKVWTDVATSIESFLTVD